MTSVYVAKEFVKQRNFIEVEKGVKRYLHTDNVFLFIPNIIDYMRLLMIVSFMYHASTGNYTVAVISYVISFALDEVDGKCARYFGQTSLFGMLLDIYLDEASVLCLCMVLSTLYPQYVILFQLYSALDFLGQWSNYQFSAVYKNNDFTSSEDWLIHTYFNKYILTLLWVYGNHVFLIMLYLSYFTEGPLVPLFGSSVGLWKLLAYFSSPWSLSRLTIMLYLLITSMQKFGQHDRLKRILARNQEDLMDDELDKNNVANGCTNENGRMGNGKLNGYNLRSSSVKKD